MKRLHSTIIALLFLFAAGCSTAPPDDETRLKKNIVIDGMNVSTMRVAEARAALKTQAQQRLMQNAVTLSLPGETVTLPLSSLGASYDIERAINEAAKLRGRGGNRNIEVALRLDEQAMRTAVDAFIDSHEQQPQDAAMQINETLATPVTFTVEQSGVNIDDEALYDAVSQAVQSGTSARIDVPYSQIAPARTMTMLQDETALIAQFSTEFSGKSHRAENRVFNIMKAAEAINGMVIDAGAEFDCNEVLGDRTEENGWKTAPGIRNGRYEDEYGGGVCQVSSTLFNAVLMANLTVVERHPHSWPMGYVDIGRDATISTGGKNFRFRNDSGAPIRLFMHVDSEAYTLTASIYGHPLDGGKRIEIVSEKTGTPEAAEEIVMLDESLPYNTSEVAREARDGKTSVTYKEYRAPDGSLLQREVIYEDVYRAIDGLTYVSTDLYYGDADTNGASGTEADAPEAENQA